MRALALIGWMAGCTLASDVRPLGADLFVVTGRSGGPETNILLAQHAAYEAARLYCEDRTSRLRPLGTEVAGDVYTLRFRCISRGTTVDQAPADSPAFAP